MPGARLAWNLARSCLVVSAETPFHVQPDYALRISFGMAESERRNPKLASLKV